MGSKVQRTTLTIPDDILGELDNLKKNKFYNDPKSKMFQYLIRLGLEMENRENDQAS